MLAFKGKINEFVLTNELDAAIAYHWFASDGSSYDTISLVAPMNWSPLSVKIWFIQLVNLPNFFPIINFAFWSQWWTPVADWARFTRKVTVSRWWDTSTVACQFEHLRSADELVSSRQFQWNEAGRNRHVHPFLVHSDWLAGRFTGFRHESSVPLQHQRHHKRWFLFHSIRWMVCPFRYGRHRCFVSFSQN